MFDVFMFLTIYVFMFFFMSLCFYVFIFNVVYVELKK